MEYQTELKQVYSFLHTNGLVNSLILLSSFIALIFIIKRIYKAFKDYDKEDKDYKVLFDIIKEYIMIITFIAIFPFVLNQVELLLAGVQDSVSSHFNASVELSTDAYISKIVDDYIETKKENLTTSNQSFATEVISIPMEWFQSLLGTTLSTFTLQIMKYLYFFACGMRYLWLLMLEILAPLAIVCMLDEETKGYFKNWLKNMFLCYMLIPFFLLADVVGELTIKVLSANNLLFSYSSYGLLAVIATLIFKIALYKYSATKTFKLID